MHEFSLVQGIMDSVRQVALENNATKVTNITLTVGEMTQIVEEAMAFSYDALSEGDPMFEGSTLTMNFVAPHSVCLECGTEFDHDRFHLKCPACGSFATNLLHGREMHIDSMEIEEEDEEEQ